MAGYVFKVELLNKRSKCSAFDTVLSSDTMDVMVEKVVDTVVWNAESDGVYSIEFPGNIFLTITLSNEVADVFADASKTDNFKREVLSGVSLVFRSKFTSISNYIDAYIKGEK